ncbi:MAG: type-F conjugative transfer system secretin TraK [Rhodocyclaceae bacterium]|nr:type-F conjugative transfer system secretin TraK [Rhodocyclaceae bacterium]
MTMNIRKYAALAALGLAPTLACALQIVEPVEGQNSFVKVSAKETTRIVIQNGKIRSLIATDGEISVEKDEERGQLFIRPLLRDKPINVRLIAASGATYNLILQAIDVPQEDIIIKEPFQPGQNGSVPALKGGTHEQNIRNVVNAMALDEPPTNVDVAAKNQEFALWECSRFVLTATYSDRGLAGDKFSLSNTCKTQMRLAEQEFYRKGVIAVVIQNMQLEAGQSTNVFVVRSN